MSSKSIVKITKFDNPYQFWFRRVEDEEKRLLLEKSWTQTMANVCSNTNYKAEVGMKILVKKGDMFKRGVIQDIDDRTYSCWLIDEGIDYKTEKVYQISLDMASKPCFAIHAGLNNIVATEMKFNLVSCKQEAIFTRHWTQGSIKVAQELISEANKAVFIRETIINDVEFGQLLITDKLGVPMSLVVELVEKQLAAIDSDRFKKGNSIDFDDTDNLIDSFSMKTSYLWDKAPIRQRNNIAFEDTNPKPSGLNEKEIKTWLLNNENINANTSTTIDSDDSSIPSSSGKVENIVSATKLSAGNPLQRLLQRNQMHKCSLNITDNSIVDVTTSKSGTIPKRPPEISPKPTLISKPDNTAETVSLKTTHCTAESYKQTNDATDCNWSQFGSLMKRTEPIDYGTLIPSGFESGFAKLTSKQSEHSSNKSVKSSRKSTDACATDKRHMSNQRKSCDAHNYSSSSIGQRRPVINTRRSADACYFDQLPRPNQNLWRQDRKPFDNNNSGNAALTNKICHRQSSDSSSFDRPVNDKRQSTDHFIQGGATKDDAHKIISKNLESDSSSLNRSTTAQELLTADNPSYDSWEENDVDMVKVKQSEEGQFLENRPKSSSVSSKSSNPSASNTQNPPSNNTGSLPTEIATLSPNNNSCKSTLSSPTINPAYKAEIRRYFNRYTCSCDKCEPWNDCEDLGPEMGLEFEDDQVKGSVRKEGKLIDIKTGGEKIDRTDQLFCDETTTDRKDVQMQTIASTQAAIKREGTKMKRANVPPVLVHYDILPEPCYTLHDVDGFIPPVIEALRRLGYKEAKPLQIYGWPAATGGAHVLLVGDPGVGKTLTHLPAVASAILYGVVRSSGREKWGREREPTVIILCIGSAKADAVYDLYYKLVGKCDRKLHIALAIPPLGKSCLDQFKDKIDILVTTPLILCKLISTHVMNLKSLNILILEDMDILLTRFQLEMAAINRLITSMLDKRTFGDSVQLLMTSEHWTLPIRNFMLRLRALPFICIATPMETALYGKAKVQVHPIDNVAMKTFHLKELIELNYNLYKTIVICNEISEVTEIVEILRVHAIACTMATSEMDGKDVASAELEWDCTTPGEHKVLVCDDHSLMNYFKIRNATTLVHFSLPTRSWKMFTQRFRCLYDSYSSPLVPNNKQPKCHIHIYVDDKCEKQLTRLVYCFKEMSADVPEAFLEKARLIHEQHEKLKLSRHLTPLCSNIKLTGHCLASPTAPCQQRHLLDHRLDRSKQKFGHLPKSGAIKFRLLSVTDATTYYVRLLSDSDWKRACCIQQKNSGGAGRCNKGGESHNGGEIDKEYGELVVEIQMALNMEGNRVRAKNGVKLGDCYILEEADRSLRRCRITKIIETERITSMPSIVEAFMLDDGNTVRIVTENLFVVPANIKKIPYLAVQVHLANILPPGRDSAFSLNILSDVQKLLQHHTMNTPTATSTSAPHYYTGVVQLQLGNALWLDDVRLMRYLRKTDVHLTSLILKNEMLGNFWGEWNDAPLKRLRELCKKHKLSVPDLTEDKTKKKIDIIQQISPQWAFLETDSWNKVNFSSGDTPNCFFVNLDKFRKQLSDLHAQILHTIKRPFYPSIGEITPGKYYLAPDTDQEDTDMCRVLVTDLKAAKPTDGATVKVAECFFVDYGNTEFYCVDKLKHLRDDMIAQLPFQAIECSFYGFKYPNPSDINAKTIHLVDGYILETGTNFFRSWFVRVVSKHTVYNSCSYFSRGNNDTTEKVKGVSNMPSRHIYTIHTYLEDQNEIFSLNAEIGEAVPELECTDLDNLIASEEAEEELIYLIVRGRQGDSDGEGDVLEESGDCGGGNLDRERVNKVIEAEVPATINYSPKEAFDKMFENKNSEADFDDFNSDDDIQIVNKPEFIGNMKENATRKQSKPVFKRPPLFSTAANTTNGGYTPMVALPVNQGDDVTLTPEVIWYQNKCSQIVIEVNIPAVVDYKVKLWLGNKLTFSTTTNSKKYSLTLRLYKRVKSNIQHKALGLCVQIKLTKLDEADWPRLPYTNLRQSQIKYDISKIEPEFDEDDEDDIPRKNRRKFLDLGPEFADIADTEQYWYNEDSDYDNSESDYALNEYVD